MCFFFFLLLLLIITAQHLILASPQTITSSTDDCRPSRCAKNGPIIQFPFQLLPHKHCGYPDPSFDLTCNHSLALPQPQTLIQLPVSQYLVVESIDYESQTLRVSDPNGCLLQKIEHLNRSAFSIHLSSSSNYMMINYSLLKCKNNVGSGYAGWTTCYSDSDDQLHAVQSDYSLDSNDNFVNCTKIREVTGVPQQEINDNFLTLAWLTPECGRCASNGRGCRLSPSNNSVICSEKPPEIEKKGVSKALKIAGITMGSCILVIIIGVTFMSYRTFKIESNYQRKIETFLQDYKALKPTRFSYMDLRKITNQFSEKLGEGGYGTVYKGRISKEMIVAVKVLTNSQGNGDDFVNEIGTIGRVHHVNVVRLVGFCAEGYRRALVYEFLPNESLEKFIFQEDDEGNKRKNSFGWTGLHDIALGIARGIEYLHQGCDQQILHFDIKPHNILLDADFNPKISDFGLAKWCSKEQSAVTMTAARGTVGYIAPEVLSRTFGKVSYKSDIYSYGMLLLELVGGRKNVDHGANASQVYFPQWIYDHVNLGEDFWAQLEEGEEGNLAKKITMVGLWCIQWHPVDRPSMKQVVQMLEGEMDDLAIPPNPFPTTDIVNSGEEIIAKLNYQPKLPIILEIEE